MKRFATVAGAVVTVLFCAVVLAGATGPKDAANAIPPCPAVTAVEAATALSGPAGWHYRHNQPASWRACMLRQ